MIVRTSSQYNKRFHLGFICRCKDGENIGVINGLKRHPYDGLREVYEQKYFYFYKDENRIIPEDTLVFYYSKDYNEFSPKAEYVTPFDIVKTSGDARTTYRLYDGDSGAYHDDISWNKIINGIPYLSVCPYCIVFPVIKKDSNGNDFCYLIETVFSSLEDYLIRCSIGILNCIYENKHNEYDNLTKFIEKSNRYINTLDVNALISNYVVFRQEQLNRRPGKDDQYFIIKESNLDSSDSYLQSLLPSKREIIDYDLNWSSATDEDNSGIYFLQEETEALKKNAMAQYTQERHLAFLIEEFLNKKDQNNRKMSELVAELKHYIVPCNDINFETSEADHYIDLINRFNSNRTIINYR